MARGRVEMNPALLARVEREAQRLGLGVGEVLDSAVEQWLDTLCVDASFVGTLTSPMPESMAAGSAVGRRR